MWRRRSSDFSPLDQSTRAFGIANNIREKRRRFASVPKNSSRSHADVKSGVASRVRAGRIGDNVTGGFVLPAVKITALVRSLEPKRLLSVIAAFANPTTILDGRA